MKKEAPGSVTDSPNRRGWARMAVVYLLMITAGISVFLLIRDRGERLTALPEIGLPASTVIVPPDADTLFHVLTALTVIIITARLCGFLFSLLRQPAVIGEIVGGIMLGPSLLGRVAPGVSAAVFPEAVSPFINVIAQLGVILYMFMVGLELDLRAVSKSRHATLVISHASILVPFILGSALALAIYPVMSPGDVPFTVFALFLGVSMSITAFPVLARILTDLGLCSTRMGNLSLTCAAIDDATAWCLLAFVVSVAQAQAMSAIRTLAFTVSFVVIVLVVIAPLVRRWLLPYLERSGRLTRSGLSIIFAAMLLSALSTELIGIHALFGAFLLGTVIPCDSKAAHELKGSIEGIVSVLFLPAFFAYTGLRTQIGLVSGGTAWLMCGAIIAVACIGKFGGSFMAARLTGLGWRDSSALGILMNTRGLVELIVLNIGLDLRVITPQLFAMLVMMALLTTFMSTPSLQLLTRGHPWERLDAS